MPIDKDAVAYGEARLACEPIIGHDAGAYHDQIGGDRAGLGVYREPAIGQFAQGRRRGAYADIDPACAVALVDHRGEFHIGDPREDARRDFDHGRLNTEFCGGGGHFQPDQPAPDY